VVNDGTRHERGQILTIRLSILRTKAFSASEFGVKTAVDGSKSEKEDRFDFGMVDVEEVGEVERRLDVGIGE